MKVVFDTNIFISMFIWRGKYLESLYHLFFQKQMTACLIPEMIDELQRVFNYPKFSQQLSQVKVTTDELLKTILSACLIFPSPQKIPHIVKEDMSDNVILACALKARADYIISGDRHLLKLKSFRGISILTPRQFITHLREP